MVKKRTEDPWMSASEYGQGLRGMGVNLLVKDIKRSVAFQVEVLGVEAVYSDPDFAVLRGYGSEWMLHADHTYSDHPIYGSLTEEVPRGLGAELRLHGCDPDVAEEKARSRNDTILAGVMNKPHGLREAYIIDPDGYIWVPDVKSL